MRDVHLLPDLAAALRRHKAQTFQRGHAKPSDFVFATAEGASGPAAKLSSL